MIHRVPKIVRFGLILVTTALLGACAEGPGGTKATPAPTPDPDPPAQPLNWADVLAEHQVEQATYVIGYRRYDDSFVHVGTGFAAYYDDAIWTNAHVLRVLVDMMAAEAHLKPEPIAVRSGTTRGATGTYDLMLSPASTWEHPAYDGTTWSPDVALLGIDGEMPVVLDLLPRQHVPELQAGQPISTMGFPGEHSEDYIYAPIATFKDGTISALIPYDREAPTPTNTKVVQHNLHLSGGTSGSLIIDRQGYVVAVNHAGNAAMVLDDETGLLVEVSRGLIDYAIRIDEAWAIVDIVEGSGATLRVAASTREPLGDYQAFPDNWDGSTVGAIR